MNVQNDVVKLTARINGNIYKQMKIKKTETGFDFIDKIGNQIGSSTTDELNETIRNGCTFAAE